MQYYQTQRVKQHQIFIKGKQLYSKVDKVQTTLISKRNKFKEYPETKLNIVQSKKFQKRQTKHKTRQGSEQNKFEQEHNMENNKH